MRNIFEKAKGKGYFCRKEKNMRKEKSSYLFKELMKPETKWYKDSDFFSDGISFYCRTSLNTLPCFVDQFSICQITAMILAIAAITPIADKIIFLSSLLFCFLYPPALQN